MPDDVIKIAVTETYDVKVESVAIYDDGMTPSSVATANTKYCLWSDRYLVLKNKELLNQLRVLLSKVEKVFQMPEEWVDLNTYINKFSCDKTRRVVEVLNQYMPGKVFEASADYDGMIQLNLYPTLKCKKLLLKRSEAVGRQILQGRESDVGCFGYINRVRRYNLLSRFLPERITEKLPKRFFRKPLDGYITDFKHVDIEAVKATAPILKSVFGPERKYAGKFLPLFQYAERLSYGKVEDAVCLNDAIEAAVKSGLKRKSGFLVLLVEGNKYRPKDILIWDAASRRWISYNYSRAEILRFHRRKYLEDWSVNNSYWASLLREQVVIVRPDHYRDPSDILVTSDGLIWQKLMLSEEIGQQMWDAWNEGYYITYNPHHHTMCVKLKK